MRVGTVAVTAALLTLTSAFNLDTQHPVIFQGPLSDAGVSRGSSYFGYAVGLTKADDGAWVLVGAPRATSTLGLHDDEKTGALFKCGTSQQPGCREVVLDTEDTSIKQGHAGSYYRDRKEGAWIGGAIDTDPSPQGKISVCGPRWMNQVRNEHHGNGVCYWMEAGAADNSSSKVVPLVEGSKQLLQMGGGGDPIHLYAYGEAGMSVHFAKNGSELLMGAPGVYNWKGSVVRLSGDTDLNVGGNQRRRRRRQAEYYQVFSSSRIINAHDTHELNQTDYFGYSVSSGEFKGDGHTYYVAGAPRASHGYGKVFIFDFPVNDQRYGMKVLLERRGSQVGGYFGGAVLGLDVSGDGRPELLVGAPMHSQQPDPNAAPTGLEEGRVYVYHNLGDGRLRDPPLVLTGEGAVSGRFGSTLASVGDLDMDGYNDIAVGAPYEDDQRGAVYIYLGGATGLSPKYSQRILASEMSTSLRGFGISISHGLDVDDNHYSDVAVGSYLSGEAVLLRAQPVLRFHAHLSPSTDKLQSTDKRFQVTACLKYFGKHLPDTVPATIQMKIESRHVKCVFDYQDRSPDNFTYERTLNSESYTCDDFTVLIKSENPDFTQPIQLSMKYQLSSSSGEVAAHSHPAEPVLIATDVTKRATRRGRRQASPLVSGDLSEFCAGCPVVNLRSPGQSQVTLSVPFSIGCDGVCQSDLAVSASVAGVSSAGFVIGASTTLDLVVNITNTGEPASLPRVQVRLPLPLWFKSVPQLCTERQMSDHVLLTCQMQPHPFPTGHVEELKLGVAVADLEPGTDSLVIGLNVTSAGEEVVPADNVRNFTIALRTEADIAVFGQPLDQAELYYDKQADRDESERNDPNYVIISHRYEVVRYLPSPVAAVNVSFLVPVNVTAPGGEQVRFLDLYRPQATFGDKSLTCSIQTGYFLAADGDSFEKAPRTWRSQYELTAAQRRLLADVKRPYGNGNATTVLGCTAAGVSCVLLQCPTVSFPVRTTNMVVTLSMRVKLHDLEPVVGGRDSLVISTIGLAEVGALSYRLQPLDDRPDLYQVHTVLLPSSLQPFPVWIIVVTVIGALLLLAAITYGLYKCGFFNRRRPEGAE